MFCIMINKLRINYAGCPASGLAAIDWRRAHGLSPEPTNRAMVWDPCYIVSESLCRLRPELLDDDADLWLCGQAIASIASISAFQEYGQGNPSDRSNLNPKLQAALAELIGAYKPETDDSEYCGLPVQGDADCTQPRNHAGPCGR